MKTIHDEAAEKVELAKTYAEDGAFASAARIYREIATMYQNRAIDIAGEIARFDPCGNIVKPSDPDYDDAE